MNDEEDDELEAGPETVYVVDEETTQLIETVIGCLNALASIQLDDDSRNNIYLIADELGQRFAIDSMEVEEQVHTTDDGEEEIIYKPLTDIFPETPDDDG